MQLYISCSGQKGLVLRAFWQVWTWLLPLQNTAQLGSAVARTARAGMQLPQKSGLLTLSNLSPAYSLLHQKKETQTKANPFLCLALVFIFCWIISASVFVNWKENVCVTHARVTNLVGVCILYKRSKIREISFWPEGNRARLLKSSVPAHQLYRSRQMQGCIWQDWAVDSCLVTGIWCRTCMDHLVRRADACTSLHSQQGIQSPLCKGSCSFPILPPTLCGAAMARAFLVKAAENNPVKTRRNQQLECFSHSKLQNWCRVPPHSGLHRWYSSFNVWHSCGIPMVKGTSTTEWMNGKTNCFTLI